MTLGREHVGPLRAAMAALCCGRLRSLRSVSASAQPAASPPPAALPPVAAADTYKLHMENGVKLFEDCNYDAARAEFRAAYEARPRANPLINIALAYKAEFTTRRRFQALSTALAKHQDSMGAADIKAAEGELKDMRALLARVKLVVSPASAKVTIDGEALPASALDQPLPLGPGTHRIAASAEGFATIERASLWPAASRRRSRSSSSRTRDDPDRGADPRMTIAVDQHVVGTGSWTGLLSPGSHLVADLGAGRSAVHRRHPGRRRQAAHRAPRDRPFPRVPPLPIPHKDPPVLPAETWPLSHRHGIAALPDALPDGLPQTRDQQRRRGRHSRRLSGEQRRGLRRILRALEPLHAHDDGRKRRLHADLQPHRRRSSA